MKKLHAFYAAHKKRVAMILAMMMIVSMFMITSVSATDASGGLDNVGTVAEFLWEQIANVVTTIVSTPLLLIPVGIFVAGAAIGLAKRFIGR